MNAANGSGNAITKNWVLALLTAIVLSGGGGWMTYVQSQINDMSAEQKSDMKQRAQQGADIEVIKEKIRSLEQTNQEIKLDIKDQNRKLDELLRRTK